MTKLTITVQNHKGETITVEGPEVGTEIRFACEPYHFGKMRVDSVDIYEGKYTGKEFHIRGTVLEGKEVSRLFGSVGTSDISGRELELWSFCQSGEVEGLPFWRYVYPV